MLETLCGAIEHKSMDEVVSTQIITEFEHSLDMGFGSNKNTIINNYLGHLKIEIYEQ